MTQWPLARLDEVAEVRLGRQRSPKNHSGRQMRPYLRAANVGWMGLLLDDVKEMNFTDAELAVYQLEPGDLLLNEASGSPGEVGKPALWSGEIEGCAFQNTLLRVRPREHEPKFLMHFFRSIALSGQFIREARGVGINHLGRARLAGWPVPVVERSEQRRIVDVVEDHLARLDAADRYLRVSSIRRQRLLASALWEATHDLEDAKRVRLDQIAEVRLGRQRSPKNHSGERMRPYLRAANVDWDRLRLDDVMEMNFTENEETTYRLNPGDILLTEASGSPTEVGKSVLYQGTPEKVCFQNTLLRVRVQDGIDPEFVQKYLLAEAHAGRFMPQARGVGINHLGRARLAALVIELPSTRAAQERAALACRQHIEASVALGHAIDGNLRRAAALRRAVLTAAFEGKLTGRGTDQAFIEERAFAV